MNKILGKFLIISMILAFSIIPLVSYAISSNIVNQTSAEVITATSKVSPGGDIEVKIDLNKIDYDNFVITLSSQEADFDKANTDVDIEDENNSTKITVEKSKLNVNALVLTYKVSGKANVGDTIDLNVKITKLEEGNLVSGSEIVKSISVTVDAEASAAQENNQNENKINNEQVGQKDLNNKISTKSDNQINNKNINSTSSKTYSVRNQSMNSQSKNIESNVYNGSNNNYLKSIKISGYDLSPDFKKTSSTYFINVSDSTNKITINAEAESSKAKVNIYGSTNLQTGKNKVLITVTAENGATRTYRIIVTKG